MVRPSPNDSGLPEDIDDQRQHAQRSPPRRRRLIQPYARGQPRRVLRIQLLRGRQQGDVNIHIPAVNEPSEYVHVNGVNGHQQLPIREQSPNNEIAQEDVANNQEHQVLNEEQQIREENVEPAQLMPTLLELRMYMESLNRQYQNDRAQNLHFQNQLSDFAPILVERLQNIQATLEELRNLSQARQNDRSDINENQEQPSQKKEN